uniref:Uncharacterized protein n=1 Tax=Aegilops tauschii subsp. strangulata TaxID=200361 RepID=A0A453BBZ4_AEGTS
MMKWTHAAGAAETLCEPWVLHRFVRACPWSHEHLRARRAASVGSRRSTIVGSAAAKYVSLPPRPLDPLPLFVSEFHTEIVK